MNANKSQNDIPLSIALLAFVAVGAAYFYLNVLRFEPEKMHILQQLVLENSVFLWLSISAFVCNMGFVGIFLSRSVNLEKQGSKLQVLQGERPKWTIARAEFWAGLCSAAAYFTARRSVAVEVAPLLIRVMSSEIVSIAGAAMSLNLAMALFFLLRLVLPSIGRINFRLSTKNALELPVQESGDLVLGTSSGSLRDSVEAHEDWVTIPSRGVHGGVFVSGSIGSGKTQGTILRYMRQLIAEPLGSPSMLAIDPKGTFLKEAERIIRAMGHGDRIVKISLKGNVTFNPVYIENPLRDSKFASLAEMVRCAAVNFMGKSSDSPFWDVSSSHLVRNTIAYLAAVQGGYFTLLDLYRTIVRASKENLADDLKRALKEKNFTEEEAFNIVRCNEFPSAFPAR